MSEVFGVHKACVQAYRMLPKNYSYIFLFEGEPVVNLESTSCIELLSRCAAVMHVKTDASADYANIVVVDSSFVPKGSNIVRPQASINVREASGGLSSKLAEHLVQFPDTMESIGASDDDIMRMYEYFSYALNSAFHDSVTFYINNTKPTEYIFHTPVNVDCFVIKQSSLSALKIEALIEDVWQVIHASFTPPSTNGALRFTKVTASRFRVTAISSYNTATTYAYFGLVDFTDSDKRPQRLDFTTGVFCPSAVNTTAEVYKKCTTSSLDSVGFKPQSWPCMRLDVSFSDLTADVLLSNRAEVNESLGIRVVRGYVI